MPVLKTPSDAKVQLDIRAARVQSGNRSGIELQAILGLPAERQAGERLRAVAARILVARSLELECSTELLAERQIEPDHAAIGEVTAVAIGVDRGLDLRRSGNRELV